MASTASEVTHGYSTASTRTQRRSVMRHTAIVHHTAQAMCSEGIAASWLACEASAPVCQPPKAWVDATTSVYPLSIRGGATGYSQKTANPIRFTSTSELRSGR